MVTHIVYQVSPEGTVTPAKLWDTSDRDALDYVQAMRRDNPDYRYQVVRAD